MIETGNMASGKKRWFPGARKEAEISNLEIKLYTWILQIKKKCEILCYYLKNWGPKISDQKFRFSLI